jgi:hypothetical protein
MSYFTLLQQERRKKFLPYIHKSMKGLEIGPSMNPTFDRNDCNMMYLDYVTREQQQQHCATINDYKRVPETDIIVTSDNYRNFIDCKYDFIVANHVIEHVQDVILWLQELESIINNDGYIFIAAPDKKYGADKYRFPTSFSHLVVDYFKNGSYSETEHTLETLFYYDNAYINKKNEPTLLMDIDKLSDLANHEKVSIGIHRHHFEGETFKDAILLPILKANFVSLNLLSYHHTGEYGEFYFILKKEKFSGELDVNKFLVPRGEFRFEHGLESLLAERDACIQEMLHSRSWRITAPLRALGRFARALLSMR